ncbi:hypothetical protein BsWGS_04191 [Bradybaena similaris]
MDVESSSGSQIKQPGVGDYIQFAESLKQQCHQLKGVIGISKLERKINAEIKFLESLRARDESTQKNHLKSSNLSHFSSLMHAAERLPGVVQVLQPFVVAGRADCLVVDVVAAQGHAWVKVVARKAQALHLIWAGQGQFGERDLVSQAEEYLECASRHPFHFSVPQVHFAFYNQVTQPMADCLRQMGVTVWGEIVPVEESIQAKVETLADDDYEQNSDTDDDLDDNNINEMHPERNCSDEIYISDIPCTEPSTFVSKETHKRIPSSNLPIVVDASDKSAGLLHSAPASASSIKTSIESKNPAETSSVCDRLNGHSSQPAAATCDLFLQLVASPPVFGEGITSFAWTYGHSVKSVTRVNLDITTLIALVSSVTNGNCNFVFRDKILSLQAQEERESPVLPALESYLKGKEVLVCETAVSSFQSILDILGGQAEKRRAADLLQRVRVVKDQPSQRALALHCQGRVKERSKVIFGTGDFLQAVTVSSNMGFVRAARSQGVVFSVYLHPARALTEEKEHIAVPVVKEL